MCAALTPVPLGDGWWESANRIAIHTAATHPSPRYLTHTERIDAALDGIVQHVHEHGWPDRDFGDLFRAAANGVEHATYEHSKHTGRGNFWVEPPGQHDALGEAITDRIGVHQLCHVFTAREWEAVWALAEVMKRGGDYRDAAALIGRNPGVTSTYLASARKKARTHWVAPGETPRGGKYSHDRRGDTDGREWRKQRRYKNRKRLRRAA